MAFNLMVGESSKRKDAPEIVGGIEFAELPAISGLLKRVDSFFLQRVSGYFEDQTFSLDEVEQALSQLLPLLTQRCDPEERAMLQKLVAVLAYAKQKQLPLHGVAD